MTAIRIKPPTLEEIIAKNIRVIRATRDMTQRDLCDMTGFKSSAFMSEVESGKKKLSIDAVERIARALGVSPSLICTHDGWRNA